MQLKIISLNFDFLDEHVMILFEHGKDEGFDDKWKIYFNGAAYLSRNMVAAVIISLEKK